MPDPFAPSSDPDIPTPTREDLLNLVHAENRDQLAAGSLPAKVAETLWAEARRQWDEGHKREALTRRAEEAKRPSTPTFWERQQQAQEQFNKLREKQEQANATAERLRAMQPPQPDQGESPAITPEPGSILDRLTRFSNFLVSALTKAPGKQSQQKDRPTATEEELASSDLSLSLDDTLQKPKDLSLEVADDAGGAMRDDVGKQEPVHSETADSRGPSGSLRAAIAFSLSTFMWSVALNVLNQKYGTSIPDWTVLLGAYIAVGFWLYWAWHLEVVRRRRRLIYTYPRMTLIVMILAGCATGGAASALLWWVVQHEQRAVERVNVDSNPSPLKSTVAPSPLTHSAPAQQRVALRFEGAKSPVLIIENRSDIVARQIKWSVVVWNMDLPDRGDPLPIPTATFDFIRGGRKGQQSPFSGALVVPLLQSGNHLFGVATVDCPECDKGRSYILYIVWGQGGWYAEAEGLDGRLLLPQGALREDRERYFQTLDAMIPARSRIPISE